MKTKQPEREGKRLSPCCKAKVDYRGGGWEGDFIHPIEEYCPECDQTLAINGSSFGVEIVHPKTGKELIIKLKE